MKWGGIVAALLAVALAGCSSSVGTRDSTGPRGCDAHCQSDLAAADGTVLPAGRAFDVKTSKCSLWNAESAGVRYYLAGVIAERLGAKNPSFTLQHSFEQSISTVCASYTNNTVLSVATTLVNVDDQWPDA